MRTGRPHSGKAYLPVPKLLEAWPIPVAVALLATESVSGEGLVVPWQAGKVADAIDR